MLTDETRNRDFPNLAGRTYLNTAAEGIPPTAVIDAINQYAQDKLLGMDGRKPHEAQWDAARASVAKAYGLSADDIGLCSCSSEAYNLAMLALQLRDGDEVVINDLDFPCSATPWMTASCAAEVKRWRNRDGALHVDDLVKLLTPRTRLVSVSMVSFFNGYRINLDEIIDAVRQHSDALVAVDVTQALGRIVMDLSRADLIVSSTHKWILGSHGGGLVGVPPQRREAWTVPAGGWFNMKNAFDDDRFDRADLKGGAQSFSVGMPNYGAVYAYRAGLDYVQSVGIDKIEQHCKPLVRACVDGLQQLPVELITPDDEASLAGIVSFRHPKSEQVNAKLHERDIHIMATHGRMRIAIHGYNTMADIDNVLGALKEILADV